MFSWPSRDLLADFQYDSFDKQHASPQQMCFFWCISCYITSAKKVFVVGGHIPRYVEIFRRNANRGECRYVNFANFGYLERLLLESFPKKRPAVYLLRRLSFSRIMDAWCFQKHIFVRNGWHKLGGRKYLRQISTCYPLRAQIFEVEEEEEVE